MIVALLVFSRGGHGMVAGGPETAGGEPVLYGNVDLRQVELAFNNSERIVAVLVQEGDRVKRGQLLARLDDSRLEPQVAEAEASAAAQRQVVARLRNGSRPQEIAEARANVESSAADAANARGQYERRKTLAENSIVSRQDLENAKAALDVAEAKLAVNQKALDLAIADRARKTSVRPRHNYGR